MIFYLLNIFFYKKILKTKKLLDLLTFDELNENVPYE